MYLCPKLNVKFAKKDICSIRRERNDVQCGSCDGSVLKEVDDVVIKIKTAPIKTHHKKPTFLTRPYDKVREKKMNNITEDRPITSAELIQELLDSKPDKKFSPTEIANNLNFGITKVTNALTTHLDKRWKRVGRGQYVSMMASSFQRPREEMTTFEEQTREIITEKKPNQELVRDSHDDEIIRDIKDLFRLCEVVVVLQSEIEAKTEHVLSNPRAKRVLDMFINFKKQK